MTAPTIEPDFVDPTIEVVTLCQDLLRIDTTNTGDLATSAG